MEIKIKYLGCGEWNVSVWYNTDRRADETVRGLPTMIALVLSHALEIIR